MRLEIHQWIILGMGILGIAVSLYGKSIGWNYSKYFPFFYAGISMLWVPFINDKKCCKRVKKIISSPEQENPM